MQCEHVLHSTVQLMGLGSESKSLHESVSDNVNEPSDNETSLEHIKVLPNTYLYFFGLYDFATNLRTSHHKVIHNILLDDLS